MCCNNIVKRAELRSKYVCLTKSDRQRFENKKKRFFYFQQPSSVKTNDLMQMNKVEETSLKLLIKI